MTGSYWIPLATSCYGSTSHTIVVVRKTKNDEPVVKRPKGRPKVDNPCKPGCPKAGRDYFKAYYKSHNAGIIINCPSCNTLTEKFNIKNHMRSKMCAKYSQFNKCQIIENSEN